VIPERYTCDGEDHSPPLAISAVPHDAKSLVLIFDDPDAPKGTWLHWLLYDLPPTTSLIVESPRMERLGGKSGINTWGRTGYGGPCPPDGVHTYCFRLYALDYVMGLPDGANRAQVEEAMAGHIVDEALLQGTYVRP